MKKPVLIFDHDGTLHDTMYVFGPAMRKGMQFLRDRGIPVGEITDAQIAGTLGKNNVDMWNALVPDLPAELRDLTVPVVGDEIERLVGLGKGRWYEGVHEMLDELKADGYHMVILSNCEIQLARSYWNGFHMEQWFDHFYECETYHFIPKTEIALEIMKDYPGEAIVIGDRAGDLACAAPIHGKSIGCLYGFGSQEETAMADLQVHAPAEIPAAVRKLTK